MTHTQTPEATANIHLEPQKDLVKTKTGYKAGSWTWVQYSQLHWSMIWEVNIENYY